MEMAKSTTAASRCQLCHILAGKLFDSQTRKFVPDQVITIDENTGLITQVQGSASFWLSREVTEANDHDSEGAQTEKILDMGHLTILPGFVDAHVHMFLHAYSETSWQDQLTKESLSERVLRAGVHARRTLMMGFTTVRDLGTEGAGDADIALRRCLAILPGTEEPIIPGPRYYCATRAIVSTGSYGPKNTLFPSNEGVESITGAEAADGIDACVRAVRRQIGAGADWVKIYADYRARSLVSDVSPAISAVTLPLFTKEEFKAMIDAAHSLGVKAAAHASSSDVIEQLLDADIDTIEHGECLTSDAKHRDGENADLLHKWSQRTPKTIWVPTLSVYYYYTQHDRKGGSTTTKAWERAKHSFQEVLKYNRREMTLGRSGIRIACGGDTGAFPHGENGLEMVLMRRLGADWSSVLSWATLGGWECVRGVEWEGEKGMRRLNVVERGIESSTRVKNELERDVPFGVIRKGWAADLVGLDGELDGSEMEFEKAILHGVKFVMKGGVVYKQDGKENP